MRLKIPYLFLLIGPSLLFCLGYLMNATVIAANHGQMPVAGPLECVYHAAEARNDLVHTCMTKDSRLKFMADWIYAPPDMGMASPGDFFELVYNYFAFPCWILWAGLMVYRRE